MDETTLSSDEDNEIDSTDALKRPTPMRKRLRPNLHSTGPKQVEIVSQQPLALVERLEQSSIQDYTNYASQTYPLEGDDGEKESTDFPSFTGTGAFSDVTKNESGMVLSELAQIGREDDPKHPKHPAEGFNRYVYGRDPSTSTPKPPHFDVSTHGEIFGSKRMQNQVSIAGSWEQGSTMGSPYFSPSIPRVESPVSTVGSPVGFPEGTRPSTAMADRPTNTPGSICSDSTEFDDDSARHLSGKTSRGSSISGSTHLALRDSQSAISFPPTIYSPTQDAKPSTQVSASDDSHDAASSRPTAKSPTSSRQEST